MIEGGCNCGAIRYRCEGAPIVVAQCHCRNCQRQSGSAFSVNLLYRTSSVTHSGEPAVYEDRDTASGSSVLRKFCPICGSALFSEPSGKKSMTIVKAGTLDDARAFVPTMSVWASTAMPWVELPPGQHVFECNG